MAEDYAAFTIPGVTKRPSVYIQGPSYYVFFGDPFATAHFDAYAPWMAPPGPKVAEKSATCESCGGHAEAYERTGAHRLRCRACGHSGPWLRTPGSPFCVPGEENRPIPPSRSSTPEEIAAFFGKIVGDSD